MHIAILETGRTNKKMPAHFINYPDMFGTLFGDYATECGIHFSIVPVIEDVFPDDVHEYDGYLVTGSAFGVYDDAPFIPKLMDFLRDVHKARISLAGVCFGHQIIAHALGGHAQKWSDGWGLGIRPVQLLAPCPWMADGDVKATSNDNVDLIHIHQDQVTSLPENAVLVGTSDFCKNAMFAIDNVVFSMQGHPEFTNEYAAALIDLKSDLIDPELFEDAHATLKNTHQGEQMGRWIMNFFAQHTKAA